MNMSVYRTGLWSLLGLEKETFDTLPITGNPTHAPAHSSRPEYGAEYIIPLWYQEKEKKQVNSETT